MKWLSQAKLYMSIIEDVVESMRELILDEGLEDRVLDDLKRVSQSFQTVKMFLRNAELSSKLSRRYSTCGGYSTDVGGKGDGVEGAGRHKA